LSQQGLRGACARLAEKVSRHGRRNRFNHEQPVQQKCGALDELNSKFFVTEKTESLTTDENKPFLWDS